MKYAIKVMMSATDWLYTRKTKASARLYRTQLLGLQSQKDQMGSSNHLFGFLLRKETHFFLIKYSKLLDNQQK